MSDENDLGSLSRTRISWSRSTLWHQILPKKQAERMALERDDRRRRGAGSTSTGRALPASSRRSSRPRPSPGRPIVELSNRPPGARERAAAPQGPRRRGHLGRGHVCLDWPVVGPDRGPRARPDRGAGRETSGLRPRSRVSLPIALVPRGDDADARRRRRGGRARARGRHRPTPGEPADGPPAGDEGLETTRPGSPCGPWPRPVEWWSVSTSAPTAAIRPTMFRGPGAAILNYVETTYGGAVTRR